MKVPSRLGYLVVAVLYPGDGLSRPPSPKADTQSVFARLLDLKPAASGPTDTPLRKLQKERFNARLDALRVRARAVQSGAIAQGELTHLMVVLAENGADLEDQPEHRLKWFQIRVDVLKEQEELTRQQAEATGTMLGEVSLAIAARADAEIDLLILKELLKKDGK